MASRGCEVDVAFVSRNPLHECVHTFLLHFTFLDELENRLDHGGPWQLVAHYVERCAEKELDLFLDLQREENMHENYKKHGEIDME